MELTAKYHLGQVVWAVSRANFKRLVNCQACNATGKITIGGEQFVCPKCGGSSAYPQNAGEKCYIDLSSRIGKVEITAYEADHCKEWDDPPIQVKYMLKATGVGSGRVWKEEELFFSEEEAQAYCDSHNLTLPQDEPGATQLPQVIPVRGSYEFAEK